MFRAFSRNQAKWRRPRLVLFARSISSEESSRPFPGPFPTRPVQDLKMNQPESSSNASDKESSFFSKVENEQQEDEQRSVEKQRKTYQAHYFDTYQMMTTLEQQGFTRRQAQVLMSGIKYKLRGSAAAVRERWLLRSDLENESYLYKAALSELRTEVQILRRNDSQLLQAEAVMMTREVEALKQEVNEGLAMLKNEVALEMNNRKNETREVQQGVDMRIQELNNHLTVMLGDMRTEIEAIRWETIWKTLAGVALTGLSIAAIGYLLKRYVRKSSYNDDLVERRIKREQEAAAMADMEAIY